MHQSRIYGIVAGGDNLEPKSTEQERERNGETRRVFFVRFNVWVEDQTKWEPDPNGAEGDRRRPRSLVQIILPEEPDRHRVFHFIEPGRRVLCSGNLTHRPGVGRPGNDGKSEIFANPRLYVGSNGVQLLDSQWSVTAGRVVNFMKKHNFFERAIFESLLKETPLPEGDDKTDPFSDALTSLLANKIEVHFSDENPDRRPPRVYITLPEGQKQKAAGDESQTGDPDKSEF